MTDSTPQDDDIDALLKRYTSVTGLDNSGDGEPDKWSFTDWYGLKAAINQEIQAEVVAELETFVAHNEKVVAAGTIRNRIAALTPTNDKEQV